MEMLKHTLFILLLALVPPVTLCANEGEGYEAFTEDHPLIYEDVCDLWPYVYLNGNGEPEGYNVDLLKLIFKELSIPYMIKLSPTSEALNHLKAGHADVTCGMDAHFHNDYAQYGKSVIQIFTHSVLHRKNEPVRIKNLEDLSRSKVIVHSGSFSHHLMIRRGWGANAVPYDDMQEAVRLVHNEPGHQIVWNTLSLQALIRKFNYDDLEVTPVNIQHGEYKFMSNNARLLQQMDSVYTVLSAEGRLQAIQNKWFYPERKDSGIPSWIWLVIGVLLLFVLLSLLFFVIYRRKEKRMTKSLRSSNRRLSLILKTSHVRIWLYHVATKTITTFNENGVMDSDNLSPNFFFYSMVKEDYERIQQALANVSLQKSERETLDVRAKDGSHGELHSLTIGLSVFSRGKNGAPVDIIGTTSDVTEDKLRQQQAQDTMLRYQTVFNSSMVDIVAYDKHGVIMDMNDKVRRALSGSVDHILASKITLRDVLGAEFDDLEHLDLTYLTQLLHWPGDERALSRLLQRDEMYYELQMAPVRNEQGRLMAVYGTGRNVTEVVQSYRALQLNIQRLQHATDELDRYVRNIDFVLKKGGVRMVSYSLDTHTLTLYSEIGEGLLTLNREGEGQLTLTQTRALTLVCDESKRIALQAFTSMDNGTRSNVEATVKTQLRHGNEGNQPACPLYLYLSLMPTYGSDGQVTGYFGMCRDLSLIKATEDALAHEAARAQEVETVKNAFLRNMSYQIRTPLNSVVGFAELFEMEHSPEDESVFIQEINDNASRLLELINDILFLSRLDAQMIEYKREMINFAEFFESRCQTVGFHHRKSGVDFVVDSNYQRLVVDIDMNNVGIIIDQILANASEYTSAGQVRSSYDYTGEALVMTFQDTGCGMSDEQLKHIFDRFASSGSRGTGLGLNICQELAQQMGGKIKVHSELGKGTIVWVTIPCSCSEIVRK